MWANLINSDELFEWAHERKATSDVYKFNNAATPCFKGPSIAMKTPILILNTQH